MTGVSGDNALVGEFTHPDGSRYVMIVNKNVTKSRPCSAQFRSRPKRVQKVSPYSGALSDFGGEDVRGSRRGLGCC